MQKKGPDIYDPELQTVLTEQLKNYPEFNMLNVLDKNGILVLPREELKRIYFSDLNKISIAVLRRECDDMFEKIHDIEPSLTVLRANFNKYGISYTFNTDYFMHYKPSYMYSEYLQGQDERAYYTAYFLTLLERFPEPNMAYGRKRRSNIRRKITNKRRRRTIKRSKRRTNKRI